VTAHQVNEAYVKLIATLLTLDTNQFH